MVQPWMLRFNHGLYKFNNKRDLAIIIRLQVLQWTGHITRMDDYRIPRRYFSATSKIKGPN